MKAVFMGTPDIAVGCLEATAAWAGGDLAVVTQPDRPRGRSGQPAPSPVKQRALTLGLEVVQPERLRREPEFLDWLRARAPEVVVVVAFGQILPVDVLETPRHGCLNVHFSDLPKYRGAAPVQRAVMAGETMTAVDIMLMDAGLDTGPVLYREPVTIGELETAGELFERMQELAPRVLTQTLEEWVAGRLISQPQDESLATLAPRLAKEDGLVDWTRPAADLVNQIRGVTPWPGAVAEVAGEAVKVLAARPGEGQGLPGSILAIDESRGILCAAGQDAVWLGSVQVPGRKPVGGAAYAHGRRLRQENSGSGR